jgi:iron(III) transport system permease protein
LRFSPARARPDSRSSRSDRAAADLSRAVELSGDKISDGFLRARTLDHYRALIETDRIFRGDHDIGGLRGGSAVVALLLGGTQAWIVERTDHTAARLVMIVSIVSLGIPSVLYTISFLLCWEGPVRSIRFMMAISGSTEPLFNVYTLGGIDPHSGIEYTPLCFCSYPRFSGTDAAFERGLHDVGRRIIRRVRRITLKLVTPVIAALLILIFIRAFEAFETPALVGVARTRARADQRHLSDHAGLPAQLR